MDHKSGVIKAIEGGVTAPQGFLASGVSCGVKEENKKDLSLVYSKRSTSTAAMFTTNRLAGAPILIGKRHLKQGKIQAVVINSGCANTGTGKRGEEDAIKMARITAEHLGINPYQVLPASTGVIGTYLPLKKVAPGIEKAAKALSLKGNLEAAEAIMTTDTHPKEIAIQFELVEKKIRLGGIAKGSGMIAPNLATMLAVLTTDARINLGFLKEVLKKAVDNSFNQITVDGETSPNDMVVILANGLAGNKELTSESPGGVIFQEALNFVTLELAKMIVKDGEGATKFIEIQVKGARLKEEAQKAAKTIANSSLVKTAFFGEDPNWGRIIAAIGHSGVEIDPYNIEISLGGESLVKKSQGVNFNQEKVKKILKAKEIKLEINLNLGPAEMTVWTTDLSYNYVKINAKYRS